MRTVNKLKEKALIDELSIFFYKKWGVPVEAYVESMNDSLESTTGVPAWYYIMDNNKIIAGLGVIENDFHKRKDLTPNICAVYVMEEYQGNGICRSMFNYVCEDLKNKGINDVYLITTHDKFYEHLGFTYYGDIEEDDGELVRCYHKNIK